MSRFDRQIILPGIGLEGQRKLKCASVLVVGAGGLGCPALLHLAAAGVGKICITDGDIVSESNLNRQTLFGLQHLGQSKAETAAKLLREKYPDIRFHSITEFLTNHNALEIVSNYDLVIDGSDNFGTRYMLNDLCKLLAKPLVTGSIHKYQGQLTVFNFGDRPVSYRDLYPEIPGLNEIPDCSQTGVLGVLPGIIGTLQAGEVIKIITGIGNVLTNRILFYNFLSSDFYEVEIIPDTDSDNEFPVDIDSFLKIDYNIPCGLPESISWEKALDWSRDSENTVLLDIRKSGELPKLRRKEVLQIPMSTLSQDQESISSFQNIILFCKSSHRSRIMATELKRKFPTKNIYLIEGGILHPSSPIH